MISPARPHWLGPSYAGQLLDHKQLIYRPAAENRRYEGLTSRPKHQTIRLTQTVALLPAVITEELASSQLLIGYSGEHSVAVFARFSCHPLTPGGSVNGAGRPHHEPGRELAGFLSAISPAAPTPLAAPSPP
jgi:hypothetical protein